MKQREAKTPIREDWMNDDASVQVPHLRRAPRL
ncbi:aspartyl-tRNA synthetase [Streptomyces viridosporus ATCC 14672]|uniref:Aspartyl-tRNA synthetase n=1 Tax=Streptomyces viridosporus (strain ATCC 14672 / DSM 40746 / JCM 4963 / KCTC 9882 / NRRL B-12104 / FH 1290) TaxID=566461 RepID=D5ZPN0_STRV1|nr:aspartyl-tRNA synthetase [Streptomyces viridosporus ATCC 14672]